MIITSGSPATDKPQDPDTVLPGAMRGSTYAEFEQKAKVKGFTLSPIQPKNQQELVKAINDALAANGGKIFKRIIILSHAGGETASPSINMKHTVTGADGKPILVKGKPVVVEVKVTADNIIPALVVAIGNALDVEGALILGTCGYYWEAPIPNSNNNALRVRDPADPIIDAPFQTNWMARLSAWGIKSAATSLQIPASRGHPQTTGTQVPCASFATVPRKTYRRAK